MLYRKIEGKPFPDHPSGAWPVKLGALLPDLQGIEPHQVYGQDSDQPGFIESGLEGIRSRLRWYLQDEEGLHHEETK